MEAYRELLRNAQVRAVSLAALLSGVGGGAVPLALVLLVREQTGSFAAAGAVVGALGLAVGVFNPIRGRLVDTKDQRRSSHPWPLFKSAASRSWSRLRSAVRRPGRWSRPQ